jgi:hypothetical protein
MLSHITPFPTSSGAHRQTTLPLSFFALPAIAALPIVILRLLPTSEASRSLPRPLSLGDPPVALMLPPIPIRLACPGVNDRLTSRTAISGGEQLIGGLLRLSALPRRKREMPLVLLARAPPEWELDGL